MKEISVYAIKHIVCIVHFTFNLLLDVPLTRRVRYCVSR